MPTAYDELLDATIQHLEELKARAFAMFPFRRKLYGNCPDRKQLYQRIQFPGRQASQNFPRRLQLRRNLRNFRWVWPEKTAPDQKPPLDPKEKAAAFAALRERVLACVKCPHLVSSRKNVVFGVGSIDAQLMFVGEAPGADEDEQGEPFVGKAGNCSPKSSRRRA